LIVVADTYAATYFAAFVIALGTGTARNLAVEALTLASR
jgi:hypothetical protein